MDNKDKNIDKDLDKFLDKKGECDPNDPTCKIPTKDGLVERTTKKYIIADGRQLL